EDSLKDPHRDIPEERRGDAFRNTVAECFRPKDESDEQQVEHLHSDRQKLMHYVEEHDVGELVFVFDAHGSNPPAPYLTRQCRDLIRHWTHEAEKTARGVNCRVIYFSGR